MVRVYTYKGCDTCRKAKKWLEARSAAFEELPIRERTPAAAELRAALLAKECEARKLFNVAGRDYRELGIKDRLPKMSEDEILRALTENGNLVKRPFLVTEKGAWPGFDEAAWRELLDVPN